LGILDPATHKFTYTNCGHNPALVVRADGSVTQLGPCGMPVGLMEVGNYSEVEDTFHLGDTLVLYTDGITEAENPEGEEYGMDRLIEVSQHNSDKDLAEMSQEIQNHLDEFANGVPYFDDRTLVLARRLLD
jgi:sigma-B regulation protein RsbU (phosphoserine phosphatase)